MKSKFIIGNAERCGLPDIGIDEIEVRVDTGAKTSSLHVDELTTFDRDGELWVAFKPHDRSSCEAKVKNTKKIKSSNGAVEKRYTIQTLFRIGPYQWLIDITLADRSEMNYLMLLGREGMGKRVLVDPASAYMVR